MPKAPMTTERIRDLYSWACAWRTDDDIENGETDLSAVQEQQRAEFDRWLADRDKEVAEAAIRQHSQTVADTIRAEFDNTIVNLMAENTALKNLVIAPNQTGSRVADQNGERA